MRSTTSWITRVVGFVLALCCAGVPAQEGAIVVGAVVSQTGVHAEEAADYRDALLLWQEEVNARGGLLGRRIDLRLLDDGSEAIQSGALYGRLIGEEKADVLIGPYGTAATMMAAAEAERSRRVLINAAGPSRAVHKRSPRFVFQTTVPYAAYGAGPIELARQLGCRKLLLVSRDDPVAMEMADAARERALKSGLQVTDVEVYPAGAGDFLPQVASFRVQGADAWVAFGESHDAGEMLKTLKKHALSPKLFFVRGASDPALMKRVGQDAEFAVGASGYDARMRTSGNPEFVKAFRAKYSRAPGRAAAEGYAAGTVLAEATRRAGSVDQEKLRAALASLVFPTVLGEYRVDPLTGEQLGEFPAVTEILSGRVQLVWPAELETAKPVLPFPAWGGRKILK